MKDQIREILKSRVSRSDLTQHTLDTFIRARKSLLEGVGKEILDLGCGDGRGKERLRPIFPNMNYSGVDIAESPEVSRRSVSGPEFATFDGRHIPHETERFDLIYCHQVLEHVRYPDELVSDSYRVLKNGGWFLGSVSQLEPYHSHSIFNWTAYGVVAVFEDHGFKVKELAPGIDGITLTLRRIFGHEQFNAFFGTESLFNHFISHGRRHQGVWERNFLKLCCAGHLIFAAQKPSETN